MFIDTDTDFEALLERDNQRQLDLLPLIEPWQAALGAGDDFAVYEPSWDLWVFCSVMKEEELWPADSAGDYLPGEMEREKESMRAVWERGFRPCQNYSVMSPEGEQSDCHVLKALLKLEPAEMEAMRGINWDVKGWLGGERVPAPGSEQLTETTVVKLIERATTPGAIKHA